MTLRVLCLLTSILFSFPARAEQPDEPGGPRSAMPAPTPQVVDIDEAGVPVVVGPAARPVQPVVATRPVQPLIACCGQPPRSRGPFLMLDVSGGYAGYAAILGVSLHGPIVSASLSMTFGSGRFRHGIRLSGFHGFQMTGKQDHLFDDPERMEGTVSGAQLGYMFQFGGGWLGAGPGVLQVQTSDSYTLPEAVVAAGYDIALGRHAAVRIGGELGTLLVTWRVAASAGLVLRF